MDKENEMVSNETEEQFLTPHGCMPETDIFCSTFDFTETTSSLETENTLSEDKCYLDESKFEEQNLKLEERLKGLKEQMMSLKEQLLEEKLAWQKEIDEAVQVAKSVGVNYSERIQHNCIDQDRLKELITKSETEVDCVVNEPTLSEIAILDYDKKLATYQEALTKAHSEKRNILKRQLAANAYRRRLLEVEKLCNMELLRIKQNVQFLQPLQALATSWDNTTGENTFNIDNELTGNVTKTENELKLPKPSGDGNKSEFVTMDDLENKIYTDLKDISSQLASNPTLLLTDNELINSKVLSMNWYSNEMALASPFPFNPLM